MNEKVRIIFIDDEPHVLNGLRRAMAGVSPDWDMAFCSTGPQALALMNKTPFDVAVSDMRMPEMDGAQLLEIVRSRYPATVRIILSGYADANAVLHTVGPAHAYLAKPCDSTVLSETISRLLAMRRMMTSEGLHMALGGITHLPSLPEPFLRIEEELRSPNASIRAVADIIATDIAMTAELLKLTNSAFFSVGSRITSTLQAVRTLGLETIQALVLRIGIFRQFSGNDPAVSAMIASLTNHSLAIAKLAESIAETEGADPSTAKSAYCAGMLCFLGMLIFLDSKPSEYRSLLARSCQQTPLETIETETFGASHGLVGAYLLGLWGFSETVVEAVALSGRPQRTGNLENPLLTALHAARALGPPLPWLTAGNRDIYEPDQTYLQACQKTDRVPLWHALAAIPIIKVK
jgi:HD-like signal output (HDOD) protein